MTVTSSNPNHRFTVETAVADQGGGRWSTHLGHHWNIDENPNGGYAVASSLRAMARTARPHGDPVSVTTHYLSPAVADVPGLIDVEVMRRGRRTTTLRSSLTQQEQTRLTTVATFSSLDQWPETELITIEPPYLPPPEDCQDRVELPQGVALPILSRLDVRLDPGRTEIRPGSEPIMSGWIRFSDGQPPEPLTLPLFADAFPPSIFGRTGPTGWVPTVELTVHVRARPRSGWIRAQFTTTDLRNGTLIEDGVLWDSAGTVVAQSRQLAILLRR